MLINRDGWFEQKLIAQSHWSSFWYHLYPCLKGVGTWFIDLGLHIKQTLCPILTSWDKCLGFTFMLGDLSDKINGSVTLGLLSHQNVLSRLKDVRTWFIAWCLKHLSRVILKECLNFLPAPRDVVSSDAPNIKPTICHIMESFGLV